MLDEIETILDTNTSDANRAIAESKAPDVVKEQARRLVDAADFIQQSVPDDLEARREAAAEFLASRPELEDAYTKKQLLGIDDIDHLLRGLIAGFNKGHVQKGDARWCAFKRIARIHTGDFSAESEYYPPEPEYPEQWTRRVDEGGGGLSEDSAEWLYWIISEKGFYDYVDCDWGDVVKRLIDKDLLFHTDCPRNQPISVRANKAPFLTGGLELPDCIDEDQL